MPPKNSNSNAAPHEQPEIPFGENLTGIPNEPADQSETSQTEAEGIERTIIGSRAQPYDPEKLAELAKNPPKAGSPGGNPRGLSPGSLRRQGEIEEADSRAEQRKHK